MMVFSASGNPVIYMVLGRRKIFTWAMSVQTSNLTNTEELDRVNRQEMALLNQQTLPTQDRGPDLIIH